MDFARQFHSDRKAFDIPAEQVIFAEGDPGDVMYAVLSGEVEIRLGTRVIDRTTTGGIFGEMALIDDEPRSASAVAVTACRVVPIDRDEFLFLVQEHPSFAITVMQVLVARQRNMLSTL